jgi:hypothetical protein
MRPVRIFMLPHNDRDPLHDDAIVRRAPYLNLPIPMPNFAMVIYDGSTGAPLAIDTRSPDGRIRPGDIEQVWRGIQEYNEDCGVSEAEEIPVQDRDI